MIEPVRPYILTLLRHGESEGNAMGHWQGQKDYPLTDKGRHQAKALGEYWQKQDIQFDVIFSSPLKRALETANTVAVSLGMQVEVDSIWMERDNGRLAGKSRVEDFSFDEPHHLFEPVGENGESEIELYLRGGRALQGLLTRPAGNYLVVAHGGILNKIICMALGIVPQPKFRGTRFEFGNTGFATLVFEPDKSIWVVRGINQLAHLNRIVVENHPGVK